MMTFNNPLSSDEQRLALIIFQTLERAVNEVSLTEIMKLLDTVYISVCSDTNKKLLENLIMKV